MIKKYSQLTIKDFQRIKEVEGQTYDLPIDKEIAVLSILTGGSIDMLEGLPKYKLAELAKETSFFKEPLPDKLINKCRIGLKRFKLELRPQNISAQQLILLNKYAETEDKSIENLHYIMATLSYEEKLIGLHKFDHDFEKKAQLFREKMTIDIAYPLTVFFCATYAGWLEATETYLIEKAKEVKAKAEARLKKLKN